MRYLVSLVPPFHIILVTTMFFYFTTNALFMDPTNDFGTYSTTSARTSSLRPIQEHILPHTFQNDQQN